MFAMSWTSWTVGPCWTMLDPAKACNEVGVTPSFQIIQKKMEFVPTLMATKALLRWVKNSGFQRDRRLAIQF